MFPRIVLFPEDTLSSVEKRLVQAISELTKRPGITPIYTMTAVKQEASRLYQKLLEEK